MPDDMANVANFLLSDVKSLTSDISMDANSKIISVNFFLWILTIFMTICAKGCKVYVPQIPGSYFLFLTQMLH